MANPKRIGMLLAGALLWVGLCQVSSQTPLAGARQATGKNAASWRAEVLPSGEATEICSQVEQPTAILYVVPSGQTIKKGDLLVELDAAALTDQRVQQVVQMRKAEAEMIVARENQSWEARAAQGQIVVAEKALRLAQSQLKAFAEGEYPRQLALAEGAAKIAKEKSMIADERVHRLQAALGAQKDQDARDALQAAQIAQQEADMQLYAAESSLSILKSFVHDNKVAELELVVAQREFDLARAQDALTAAKARGGTTMSLAEMQYHRESDRLAKLDDQIVKSKIYAPRDGIVAYPDDANEPPIKAGTVVRARQVLLRLSDVATPRRGE